MNVYSMPDRITYNKVSYTILSTLEHGLLLVVETSEFELGKFPLKPLVIPNEIVG